MSEDARDIMRRAEAACIEATSGFLIHPTDEEFHEVAHEMGGTYDPKECTINFIVPIQFITSDPQLIMTRAKPTIPEVRDRFAAYHEANIAWGSLHIVLDDCNFSDSSVEFCLKCAIEQGDTEGAELAEILLRMSKTQRAKIGRV